MHDGTTKAIRKQAHLVWEKFVLTVKFHHVVNGETSPFVCEVERSRTKQRKGEVVL